MFEIYPLGDLHVGARSLAERHLRQHIGGIAKNPKAYAIGGGDWLEAVIPNDIKRFDFDVLPDWMLEGDADDVRGKLKDILTQQRKRFKQIVSPIPAERWLGAIEGNHEHSINKYHNRDIFHDLCTDLDIENLTDEALVRLRFKLGSRTAIVILYIRHGYGGGRTAGAEPAKLYNMIAEWEIADILLHRPHAHVLYRTP